MGKISNYTRALVAKLQDVFVVDQTDNNVTTTKSVTVEQIGDTIAGTQVHSDLKTDNQTIIGGINELAKDKNIADEYDDTQTYNKGDVVIYKNTLYICTANNTTGDFDPSNWTATTIDNIIGSLSALTTSDKSSLVEAVNSVNNLPRPSVSLAVTRSDVQTWNTSLVINQRSGTINTFFIFKNNSTAQPTITHSINCSRTITGLRLVAYNALSERSTDATYDTQTGNIVWVTGLPSGVWLVMGTITYS